MDIWLDNLTVTMKILKVWEKLEDQTEMAGRWRGMIKKKIIIIKKKKTHKWVKVHGEPHNYGVSR